MNFTLDYKTFVLKLKFKGCDGLLADQISLLAGEAITLDFRVLLIPVWFKLYEVRKVVEFWKDYGSINFELLCFLDDLYESRVISGFLASSAVFLYNLFFRFFACFFGVNFGLIIAVLEV